MQSPQHILIYSSAFESTSIIACGRKCPFSGVVDRRRPNLCNPSKHFRCGAIWSKMAPSTAAPTDDWRGGFRGYFRRAPGEVARQKVTLTDRLLPDFGATQHGRRAAIPTCKCSIGL